MDYSSPNIAKEMHVGHLRTTIVGDAIVRVLELVGHHVIRDNHVGDWGTPFGMLLEHLVDVGDDSAEAGLLRTDPNAFYQAARVQFDADPAFADRARDRVVKLQSGNDPATQRLWDELMELSKDYLRDTYAVLRVTLADDDIRGESFYNDMLRSVADDLVAKGLATISDGALCAFPAGFQNRDGSPLPLIIVKSDGGYNYATTDLATIRYRVDKLNADRALYVVGSDQAQHFKMVFEVAREAGWLPDSADFEHAQVGMVQGKDGRRLRTRAGDNVALSELIAEGPQRARALLDEVERDDEGLDLDAIAQDVGIGAIKYADLSTARESAYIFDWDRMISFKGNTGPYLQYATARIRSIFRRAQIDEAGLHGPILHHGAGRARAGQEAAGVRPGRHAGRRDRRTAPALLLPVRARQPVHLVLRAVPGPQGRRRGDQELPARAVRGRPADPDGRPRPARRPRSRPDVSSPASCRNGQRETNRHRCRSLEGKRRTAGWERPPDAREAGT